MNGIVAFSLRHRGLVVLLFVLVLLRGVVAFPELNIEAYPDPTPPMVDVITQSPGLSAEEIERYITIPIETQLAALRNLTSIRTISLYGLSDVKLQFSFEFTYEQALQQVLNRRSQLPALPNNVQPQISPVSPIGEIYRYKLVGPPGYSVLDLKTLQDWVLQRRFRAVPGVVDVTGWGGKTKVFELQVDYNRLIAYGLTLGQVVQTLNNSNINVGGNTINIGSQSAVVRGVGLIRSLNDLNNTMLTQAGGNPVLRGESANLLSVGAIDFGLIVDATVIMVESIFRRLGRAEETPAHALAEPAPEGLTGKLAAMYHAGVGVSRSIFFAAGIIIAAFIPLFTLSGVEGHIFGPMAKTSAYALAGGLIATF